MRADARKNYDHLLAVAREVVSEYGAEASLRDIARRAGVGLATLYRHFPSREALLDALLQSSLDELTRKAVELEQAPAPGEALRAWLIDAVAFVHRYSGVVALLAAALADEQSALHASCATMRSAGARLLVRAQTAGAARADLDGADLLALIGALGWIGDQPPFAPRARHLFDVVASAILIVKPGDSTPPSAP